MDFKNHNSLANPTREAKITAWETTFFKSVPLVLFIIIAFSTIPDIKYIDESLVPKIMLFIAWTGPVFAFGFELWRSWPNKNERGHFGAPLLAIFTIIGGILAANSWFEFYQFGNNSWIDMLGYLYIFLGVVILAWAARVEYFKHKRLRYNIYTSISSRG